MKARLTQISVILIGLLLAGSGLFQRESKDSIPYSEWGSLPVLEGGRIKPFESVARNYLLMFRGKQSIRLENEKISANQWLAETLMDRKRTFDYPTFRVDHPQVQDLLDRTGEKYHSYSQVKPYLSTIQQRARAVPEGSKDVYDTALLNLFSNLIRYQKLMTAIYPWEIDRVSTTDFMALAQTDSIESLDVSARRLALTYQQNQSDLLYPIPTAEGTWEELGSLLINPDAPEPLSASMIESHINLITSLQQDDAEGFTESLESIQAELEEAGLMGFRLAVENVYNHLQIFFSSIYLYTWILLLCLFGLLLDTKTLHRPIYLLLALAFLFHTLGIASRVVITGYAPVTNLYSSAVFVGWVAIGFALLYEKAFKNLIGSLSAAAVGICTLVVAHHLSNSGDTMQMMSAVLNSNFWLTTHVLTITIGYGASFLAGFIALGFLSTALFKRTAFQIETVKSVERMVYATICFSLLFSFIGTVLGGIWADQSWGRFWGWDPKENGALMIVIWNAIILHALKCRWARLKGLLLLSIGGNIITAWSWFGTNMLGVGLHSYGFMNQAFFWLSFFCLSQIIFITLLTLHTPKVLRHK